MHSFTIFFLASIFATVQSQFTNVYPSIVQILAEGSPTQAFENTAGSSNLFYVAAVSANEGRDAYFYSKSYKHALKNDHWLLIADWIFTNRVVTALSFDGIPPFATTCQLIIELPPDNLLWQVAVDTNGQVLGQYSPTMFVYPLDMPISQSSSWTVSSPGFCS